MRKLEVYVSLARRRHPGLIDLLKKLADQKSAALRLPRPTDELRQFRQLSSALASRPAARCAWASA